MNTDRFLEINNQISLTFEKKEFDRVKELVSEYSTLADRHKSNWNYGNAILQSHTYLGLVALEENNIEKAKEYLLLSGKTKGSPQLKSEVVELHILFL